MDIPTILAHYDNIIILTRALSKIASGDCDTARSAQEVARQAIEDWDVARAKKPVGLPNYVVSVALPVTGLAGDANNFGVLPAYEPVECPKCGGTWPTACSCPVGTQYEFPPRPGHVYDPTADNHAAPQESQAGIGPRCLY